MIQRRRVGMVAEARELLCYFSNSVAHPGKFSSFSVVTI